MSAFPAWLVPMAATLTERRFNGPEWIFERKYDGIRLLAFKHGRDVRLYSRNRLPQNLPRIAASIARLPARDVILDGELTWDRDSAYHVFDILWHEGRSLTALPLVERQAILKRIPLEPPLQRVKPVAGQTPWERACAEGWEGVIAKRLDSPYEHRRSKLWLKMKCETTAEFVIGGFTDPQGGRVGLGALLVGRFDDGEFVFAGKVGTGFDTRMLVELRRRLEAAEIPATPFTKAKGLPRLRAHWVCPEIRIKVAFTEWTVHKKLRHSRLLEVLPSPAAASIR